MELQADGSWRITLATNAKTSALVAAGAYVKTVSVRYYSLEPYWNADRNNVTITATGVADWYNSTQNTRTSCQDGSKHQIATTYTANQASSATGVEPNVTEYQLHTRLNFNQTGTYDTRGGYDSSHRTSNCSAFGARSWLGVNTYVQYGTEAYNEKKWDEGLGTVASAPNLNYYNNTGNACVWYVDNGAYYVKGLSRNSVNSQMQMTINCSVAMDITFEVYASTEGYYDKLIMYDNNIERGRWSGSVSWPKQTVRLAAGSHNIISPT